MAQCGLELLHSYLLPIMELCKCLASSTDVVVVSVPWPCCVKSSVIFVVGSFEVNCSTLKTSLQQRLHPSGNSLR